MIFFAMLVAAQVQSWDQSALPPALQLDQREIATMMDRGYQDAAHKKRADGLADRTKRELGRDGWIWLNDAYLQAYKVGYDARKQYWGDDEYEKAKERWRSQVSAGRRRLDFYGILDVPPSKTKELSGVRVVLKVGEHIYQPEAQPGNLRYEVEDKLHHHHETESLQGSFSVSFDLFGPTGVPRLDSQDKKITVIVIYGDKEKDAVYTMDSILAARR